MSKEFFVIVRASIALTQSPFSCNLAFMEQAEKTQAQAELLKNRIAKNSKALRKWARKNLVAAYRLYDRDIPEIPLAIDLYEFLPEDIRSPEEAAAFMQEQAAAESANIPGAAARRLERTFLKVFLYERPYEKPEEEERAWLCAMTDALADCLQINRARITTKTRLRDKGGSQYAKESANQKARKDQNAGAPSWSDQNFSQAHKAGGGPSLACDNFCGRVYENGAVFYVDLATYLDTGLFLDMRAARALIKANSQGKRVLNLFCYTSSFSVAAALGGAAAVLSVDLSNTYLDWSRKNAALNGLEGAALVWTKADVSAFLDSCKEKFDMIILDPPTFSASKSAKENLDTNRDWPLLCQKCLRLLDKGGELYFSTNSRSLKFDAALLPGALAQEITEQTIDPDFKQKKSHRMWLLQNKNG